jgi:hypothetical protein
MVDKHGVSKILLKREPSFPVAKLFTESCPPANKSALGKIVLVESIFYTPISQ